MAVTILHITDTAFLGRVGEVELGASAIGGILYLAFSMIGISIGTGAQIIISRRTGERNDRAVGEVFDNSLLILLLVSTTLFALLKWLFPAILKYLITSEELIEATTLFLSYRSYGLIFVTTATAFRSFYVGIAKPRIIGVYSFLLASINIFLGYIFIFGHLGCPPMGIAGAGAASTIAECCALIFLVLVTFRKKIITHYNLLKKGSISKTVMRNVLNLSLPLALQNILSIGSWFIFFVFIEKFGQHELAISNIIRAAYVLSMTPVWGFSVAANSMVSNIIGQNRADEVFLLLKKIIRLTLSIAIAMVLINLIIPTHILGLFTSDENLIRDSTASFYVVDVAMIFFSFAIIAISSVSGTGATRVALYIEIAAIILYLVYNYIFTYLVPLNVEILWMSEIIYWVFTGMASFWYISSMRWLKYRV